MAKRTYRVVVDLDVRHQAAREVIAGVLRFAAKHPEWDVQMRGNHPSNDGFTLDPNWKPDGLIIDDAWRTHEGEKLLAIPSLRGVVFTSTLPPTGFRVTHESVATDDRALAVTAAKLFRQHGLTNFAFIGTRGDERWCEARKRFFRAALKDAGFGLSVYKSPRSARKDWSEERKAMAEWIKSLPKPCGVLAYADEEARDVYDACRVAGLSIPEQVAVIGIDNELDLCESSRPTLTSIQPAFEQSGILAAEALDTCFVRKCANKTRQQAYGIDRLVERASTQDVRGFRRLAAAVNEILRKEAYGPLTVADLARRLNTSTRMLQLSYSKACGETISNRLQTLRLAKIKELLSKSKLPITEIAAAAGYSGLIAAQSAFRRQFGLSMRDYRKTDTSQSLSPRG